MTCAPTTNEHAATLDILHITCALELGCVDFLSFDHRQRATALALGLRVVP